jgi:hypothetical protein
MTAPVAQQSSARAWEAEFLDLICADEELLRAEFDAIVAAAWPTRLTAARGTGRRLGGPSAGGRGGETVDAQRQRPEPDAPKAQTWTRERSPPAPGPSTASVVTATAVCPARPRPGCAPLSVPGATVGRASLRPSE